MYGCVANWLESYQCSGQGTVQEPDECESLKSGFEGEVYTVKAEHGLPWDV
jgi:hypothetical protein